MVRTQSGHLGWDATLIKSNKYSVLKFMFLCIPDGTKQKNA